MGGGNVWWEGKAEARATSFTAESSLLPSSSNVEILRLSNGNGPIHENFSHMRNANGPAGFCIYTKTG